MSSTPPPARLVKDRDSGVLTMRERAAPGNDAGPMASLPASRRPPYQRTGTGGFVSDIAHPYLAGQRLRLSAKTAHDLAQQKTVIESWVREYRFHGLSLEELRNRLARFENRRAPAVMLRAAWEAYTAAARPSMLSRLGSVWRKQLAPELAELAVVHLTARRLQLWEARAIAEGYAPKTTRDAFMLLAAAVRASLTDGEDLPWKMGRGKYWKPSRAPVPLKERPACGTAEEAELLIHAALERDRDQRAGKHGAAYALRLADLGQRCTVTLFLALRNGELAGLGWDDLALDVAKPKARIRHQAVDQWRRLYPDWTRPLAPPKGGRMREVAIHPTALLALAAQRELLEQRGWYRDDGPVFPGHEGTPFAGTWRNNANGIRPDHMKELAAAAGLPFPDEWVTHCLRHSLATVESTSGADLRTIQRRTGHGSLRALEGYIHARTGRALAPSAVPQLALNFDLEHDTEPDLRLPTDNYDNEDPHHDDDD